MISPEEMMERYRRGLVGLDDAADYFYKRLHPRRYRWLDRASRRIERYERLRIYYTGVESVGRFAAVAVTRGLLALFSIHYRRTSGKLAEMVLVDRTPALPGGRPCGPIPHHLRLVIIALSTGLVILSAWVPVAALRQSQDFDEF